MIALQNSIKPPTLSREEKTAGRTQRGCQSVCLSCRLPCFLSTSTSSEEVLSVLMGASGCSQGWSHVLAFSYPPLWKHLRDNFFQWKDISPKRPLALLSRKVPILPPGPTEFLSQNTSFENEPATSISLAPSHQLSYLASVQNIQIKLILVKTSIIFFLFTLSS